MVKVKVHSGDLTEAVVGQYGVVVMCSRPVDEILKWDTFCHEKVSWFHVLGHLFIPVRVHRGVRICSLV